jgi:hypothetical protein
LNATIKVVRHSSNWTSIIGNMDEFNAVFKNQDISNGLDKNVLKGYAAENPSMEIIVKFTKIVDLP